MIISKNLQNKLKQNGWNGELELDILNDIAVKYAKEFFGEEEECSNCSAGFITSFIIIKLQQSKPQEEIEKYIWDNCKFKN